MNEANYNSENTCICCGEAIPEGRQVCRKCEFVYDDFDDDDEEDNDWEDELYND